MTHKSPTQSPFFVSTAATTESTLIQPNHNLLALANARGWFVKIAPTGEVTINPDLSVSQASRMFYEQLVGYGKPCDALQDQVRYFHKIMGSEDPISPVSPDDNERYAQGRIELEEFTERAVALVGAAVCRELFDEFLAKIVAKRGEDPGGLAEIAAEGADCMIVVESTAQAFGVNTGPVNAAVCAANNRKVGGGVDEHGKFRKPPSWVPADIQGELVKQGWKP